MTDRKVEIHRAKRAPLRDAFPHEAHHFTVWLEENIDALADELGIKLTVLHREHTVGPYRADLLCEDEAQRRIIVENQLEQANLGHLGQVLMYLLMMDAKTAVWVAAQAAPEYIRLFSWLNEITPADIAFYLVRAEAIQIGESAYAPLFTVLVRPTPVSKVIGQARKELDDRSRHDAEFVAGLLTKTRSKTHLFDGVQPVGASVQAPSSKKGVYFEYDVQLYDSWVQLHFNMRDATPTKGEAIYQALQADREAIERELGHQVEWQFLGDKARIVHKFKQTRLMQPETWPELQDRMVALMLKYEQVFVPRLAQIGV